MAEVLSASRVLTPGGVLVDGAVAIDGAAIAWVGPTAALPPAYDSWPRTHADGATITPGLVDCHVHLGFDGGSAPVARMLAETDDQQRELMRTSARQLLHAGVTTARDLGARNFLDVETRDAIRAGPIEGPRLLVATRPITRRGGHCWFMGGEADTEAELRALVRDHHAAGADVVKVMATGGFMTDGSTPWDPQFTTPQLRAIVDEAAQHGLPVAAHAHGATGIRSAVEAGVRTLEHCSFPGGADPLTADPAVAYDDDLAAFLADSDVFVSPTMNVECRDASADLGFTIGEYLPGLHARGVRMIAGTDAGIDRAPHGEYVGGLEYWAELGFAPHDIIGFATSDAADALGLGGVTGRLAVGLAADLLVVDGDPLVDVAAFRGLRRIVAAGRTVRTS